MFGACCNPRKKERVKTGPLVGSPSVVPFENGSQTSEGTYGGEEIGKKKATKVKKETDRIQAVGKRSVVKADDSWIKQSTPEKPETQERPLPLATDVVTIDPAKQSEIEEKPLKVEEEPPKDIEEEPPKKDVEEELPKLLEEEPPKIEVDSGRALRVQRILETTIFTLVVLFATMVALSRMGVEFNFDLEAANRSNEMFSFELTPKRGAVKLEQVVPPLETPDSSINASQVEVEDDEPQDYELPSLDEDDKPHDTEASLDGDDEPQDTELSVSESQTLDEGEEAQVVEAAQTPDTEEAESLDASTDQPVEEESLPLEPETAEPEEDGEFQEKEEVVAESLETSDQQPVKQEPLPADVAGTIELSADDVPDAALSVEATGPDYLVEGDEASPIEEPPDDADVALTDSDGKAATPVTTDTAGVDQEASKDAADRLQPAHDVPEAVGFQPTFDYDYLS